MHLGEQRRDRFGIGHVAGNGDRPGFPGFLYHRVQRLDLATGHRQAIARLGERQCHRAPDARSGTRYQYDLSVTAHARPHLMSRAALFCPRLSSKGQLELVLPRPFAFQ